MLSSVLSVRQSVIVPLRGEECSADFISFDGFTDGKEHFALRINGSKIGGAPLVRIHSECVTGDIFGSRRCDCGLQLNEAVARMTLEGGYIVYLRQEGRGIGFNAKIDAYRLQDEGLDTFEANERLGHPADARSFDVAAHILQALSIDKVRLVTNNPKKVRALKDRGIAIEQVLATSVYCFPANRRYLEAKAKKASHNINLDDLR